MAGFWAWFKNGQFWVTHGFLARTLIGPAARAGSPRTAGYHGGSLRSARTGYTPEAPANVRGAHPSATPRDSCRLDWGLHCAGIGGGSGKTGATSSSRCPTAFAG